MIQAQQLTKWYGPTRAVDDVSFQVEPGQIVGFLGPNGAGKSTTLRILTGYMPPTAGSASIDGHDVLAQSRQARDRIGYLPESTPLYPEMRVHEYLHYHGRLHGMSRTQRKQRIGTVCERCGLTHNRRRVIGQLSKGNRQRVGLAQALLHEPPVLILDEPTAGLDPNQVGEFRQFIRELREKHTIMLSTHILPEVEKVADRVIIIARGRIVAQGTPDELRRKAVTGARIIVEARGGHDAILGPINDIDEVASVEAHKVGDWTRVTVTPRRGVDVRARIGKAMLDARVPVRELRPETASLEAFFIQTTAPPEASPAAASAASPAAAPAK